MFQEGIEARASLGELARRPQHAKAFACSVAHIHVNHSLEYSSNSTD
jgi:hypothetical protein